MGRTVLRKYRIMNRLLLQTIKKVLKIQFTVRNGAQLDTLDTSIHSCAVYKNIYSKFL